MVVVVVPPYLHVSEEGSWYGTQLERNHQLTQKIHACGYLCPVHEWNGCSKAKAMLELVPKIQT
jgi:hypothetical protein